MIAMIGCLNWVSNHAQVTCENFQDGIVVAGNERGLEYHLSEQSPAVAIGALTVQRATAICERSQSRECNGLFFSNLCRLGHFGSQHRAGLTETWSNHDAQTPDIADCLIFAPATARKD
ncbi:MAG: hypothetical protein N4A70_11960 [Pelagimonas sp.]|jgi:hypothetical protein|nr:hypothetical protein [Pelagimonas sp.]